MTTGAHCPQCGEPLLAYEADAGRYVGCPECLWMGESERPLTDGDQHTLGEVLDEGSDDDLPDWLLRNIEEPPRRD